MNKKISNHPTQKYIQNEVLYFIEREFKEIGFLFNSEKKYISLTGQIIHFVTIENERIDLPYLNYHKEIIASNKTLVYADNGDYIVYEKDEEGNIVYQDIFNEEGELVGNKPKIIGEERGILGEYNFFELLRNVPTSINAIISNVIDRADSLGDFNV